MDTSSRQKDLAPNHEATSLNIHNTPRSTLINNPRKWSSPAKFKNPRIVRVESEHGGKDRHSKVFTVKGLRDRRIRLSVPTSIQLYDLQHRLGLNQPGKVMDWLIEATKHDINQLPPLQMCFGDQSSLPFLFNNLNPNINDEGLMQQNKLEEVEEQDLFRTESSIAHFPSLGNSVLFPYPKTWEGSNSNNVPNLLFGNHGSSFPFTSEGGFLTQPPYSGCFLPPYPQFINTPQQENYDTKPFAYSFPLLSSNSQQSEQNPRL